MLRFIKSIATEFNAAFGPQDPLRFSAAITAPPNWFGELEALPKKERDGAILVNRETNTYEFGRVGVEIDPNLTALDIEGLRKKKLDPNNPAYAKCKLYFSKMPFCNKEDLAANSGGETHDPIKPHTAKDVLAVFRAFLVDKPTF